MGRPPKKRMRGEDEDAELGGVQGKEQWPDLGSAQLPPTDIGENALADGLFPQVYCAPYRVPHAFPHLLSMDNDYGHSLQACNTGVMEPLPATTSPWPDFSSVSAATGSSFAKPAGSTDTQSSSSAEQDNHSSAAPQCSCLSYLYLCLSHLSSLSPFPISHHTLCSLFIGAKTARDVIRCAECPKTYATGVQNVMLTGTLLNVAADGWLRVSKADPVELGKQAAPPAYVTLLTQTSQNFAESWKQWLRQTVRNAVIGGPLDPAGRVRCSDSPNLLSLVTEFEARQQKWHAGKDAPIWVFPQNSSAHFEGQGDLPNGANGDQCDEKDYLCLRVIRSVKDVISKFDFEPHESLD